MGAFDVARYESDVQPTVPRVKMHIATSLLVHPRLYTWTYSLITSTNCEDSAYLSGK